MAVLAGIVFAILTADVFAQVKYKSEFEDFKWKFGKRYVSKKENDERFNIFANNMNKVEKMNNGNKHVTYGATKYSDLTEEEFERLFLNRNIDINLKDIRVSVVNDTKLPINFDWRSKNVVSDVKDQGFCRSSWAFSVVANIESLHAIKNKDLVTLSKQDLIDCDRRNFGCCGGYPISAFKFIKQQGGLVKEEDYGYIGKDGMCRNKGMNATVSIQDFTLIPKNEQKMAVTLYQEGPISVYFNGKDMQHYIKGVSRPGAKRCTQNPKNANYAALIVGFGNEKGVPYWIIKNSWGINFGEKGYYRLLRGKNLCGIKNFPSSAIL